MPDGGDTRSVKVLESLHDVSAADWDRCAGVDNPFVSHAFLSALEESGSATAETGWMPRHIVVEDGPDNVVACAPLYLKSHSYGEYVFDWGWADAYERAGGRYYPKLQCAVPFTPVPGPRLLISDAASEKEKSDLKSLLAAAMAQVADQLKLSSVHMTFCDEDDWQTADEVGYLKRIGQQFHWHNDGYDSFDDFLGALASRKRKSIKRERRKVLETGLDIKTLSGHDIHERHWDAFFEFYLSTTDKKWGQSYLHREFFSLIGERMPENVVLVFVEEQGRPVAGALNLRGSECLYGRNWGALKSHDFLHFECCYYRAIDYAIEHGLARVEAGAQGPHKVQRGYLPVQTQSAHFIRDRALRDAIERFLVEEKSAVESEMTYFIEEYSPYRKSDV